MEVLMEVPKCLSPIPSDCQDCQLVCLSAMVLGFWRLMQACGDTSRQVEYITQSLVSPNRPISQTVFMLSIAINRAEHVCATVIIKHNYMLMCNRKIVINIMLCL